MAHVEPEPGLVVQPGGEVVQQRGGRLVEATAAMAHEVDVLVLPLGIGGSAVAEMGVAHESEPLQEVERSIDRGDVHG